MNTRIGILFITIGTINGTAYACGNAMEYGNFVPPELITSISACILLLSSLVTVAYLCLLLTKPIYLKLKKKSTNIPSPLLIFFLTMIFLISHYVGRQLLYSNTPMISFNGYLDHPNNLPFIITHYNNTFFYLEVYFSVSLILFLGIFIKDREDAKGKLIFGKLIPIGIFITLFGAIAFSFIVPAISRISQLS